MGATLILDQSVSCVRLVSPARAKALGDRGMYTVRDLISHYPRRYLDLSTKHTVASAVIGQSSTIEGKVHEVKLKRPKPHISLVELTVVDGTGTLMVTCFRQPWVADQVRVGMRLALAGTLEFSYGYKRMTNPYWEVLEGETPAQGRVIPIHPACERISVAWMRRLVHNALLACCGMYDPLPLNLRRRYRLMSRYSALWAIQFPHSLDEIDQARRRLVYEEVLLLELMLMRQNETRFAGKKATAHVVDGPRFCALIKALPFKLTAEQERARDDILTVLAQPKPANHMLLGDVGTGKTVVAACALAAAIDGGGQGLLMAPTEVLARQHGETLGPLFDAAGISWAVLSGSTPQSEAAALKGRLARGEIDVLVGTHALLEKGVIAPHVTLVVIDEQQRFGVAQRAALLAKGSAPDALFLTATPIPRTLALALYGNLTLSYITRHPFNTTKRTTLVHQKTHRGHAYDAAREALQRGEQVFVVCPLIGQDATERNARAGKQPASSHSHSLDNEGFEGTIISIENDDDFHDDNVSAAVQEAAYLQSKVFSDWHVELLHGKMPTREKQAVMKRFRENVTQVLVATTVIEVGVDVANATVMIVEDADRFGLSQLHQLRGRVGRGDKSAQIHLISASKSASALSRLAAMERTCDGFELATYDLSLRREGDILGNRQHGTSGLKLVNIIRDAPIIEAAHADAHAIISEDPHLSSDAYRALGREVALLSGAGQGGLGG